MKEVSGKLAAQLVGESNDTLELTIEPGYGIQFEQPDYWSDIEISLFLLLNGFNAKMTFSDIGEFEQVEVFANKSTILIKKRRSTD